MIIRKASKLCVTVTDRRAIEFMKELFNPWSEEPNASIFWAMFCEYKRMRNDLHFTPQLAFNEIVGEWNHFLQCRLSGTIKAK